MANDFLKSLVKEINDENTHLLEDEDSSSEFTGGIDTGSYILNAAFSGSIFGGIPNNKITALAGESSTGKTFFALGVIKHFLDNNADAVVFYYDTEAAVTRSIMDSRGIDTSRVVVVEPTTVQEFRTHALNVLAKIGKDHPPMIFVLDSLGQLSTTKEIEDTAEGKETRDMTKAQLIKATFRVLGLKLAKAKIPLIVTNHVYDVIGSYIPMKEMSGGSGLKYTASQICFLSKKKDKDGTEVVGNIIKCTMTKSRFTKENKQVEVKLSYQSGLDRYYGLLDLAEKGNIFKKVSTRYETPDGTKVFAKQIMSNPEKYFTEDILNKIDEIAKDIFCYGRENELNIDSLEGEDDVGTENERRIELSVGT
jgi:RecA/RadA recombinase